MCIYKERIETEGGSQNPITMKLLAVLVALSLSIETYAMEKTIDEIMEEANNDSMSYDLMSGSSSNPMVRIERDIMMTLEDYTERQKMEEEKSGKRMKRKATIGRRWPSGRVPYEIEPGTFSSAERTQIDQAIADWNRETCLNFQPRNGEPSAVRFQNGQGCSSFVGRTGNVQPISLARGCRIKRIVIHEMGHAIGFNHEQSRDDRDRFVRIRTENIPQPLLFNFQRLPSSQVNSFGVPYDYRSVMHYGARDFSTNGQITVETLDTNFQNIIGRSPGLSFRDIRLANAMYNCAGNCPQQTCEGEGFVDKNCQCKCPTNDPNNPIQNCQGTPVGSSTSAPVTTTTTTPSGECSDMNRFCAIWAQRGFCSTSKYMMMYCKESCNLCSAAKICEDMGQSCSFLQQRGFCGSDFFRDYMASNCGATCGFCRAGEPLGADGNPIGNNSAPSQRAAAMFLLVPVLVVWRLF
uniref:Metalloendopeptidase n=1 Tax=Crassostrea virginica TaxID=6565 RepID=A0A8B8E7W9_CRAVI|nr:low choriolytic enzyme-like [Crassostrea virginica]